MSSLFMTFKRVDDELRADMSVQVTLVMLVTLLMLKLDISGKLYGAEVLEKVSMVELTTTFSGICSELSTSRP